MPPRSLDMRRPILFWTAVAVVLCAGLGVRVNVAGKHALPRGDEGPWLRCASTVWTGAFLQSRVVEHDLYPRREIPHPEDNRSPLFPVLIALAGLGARDLFAAGKLLNLAVFAGLTILGAGFSYRRWGPVAGLSAAVFLCASPLFIVYSTEVYADLLVALGFAGALVHAPRSMQSPRDAAVAGLLFGALFLLKTTAVFLVPVYLWYWWEGRGRAGSLTRAASWLLPAVLLSAPWLARNLLAFGSPTHQFVNYHLFTEKFTDVYRIGQPEPTLGLYLQQQGPLHVVVIRPLRGLFAAVRDLSWFDHYLSLALVPFAAVGIGAIRRDRGTWLPWVIFSAGFLPMVAYFAYAVWVNRFTLVFYVAIYGLAAIGIARIAALAGRRGRMAGWTAAALCAALPLLTVARPLEFYASPRGSERSIDADARAMVAEMRAQVPDSQAVLSSIAADYAYLHRMGVVRVLDFKDWRTLQEFAATYRISQALLLAQEEARVISLARDSGGAMNLTLVKRRGGLAWYRIDSTPDTTAATGS